MFGGEGDFVGGYSAMKRPLIPPCDGYASYLNSLANLSMADRRELAISHIYQDEGKLTINITSVDIKYFLMWHRRE